MKRGFSLLILTLLLLAVAACGGGNDQPAAETPATAAPAVAQQPQAAPAAATNTPAPSAATPVLPAATPAPAEEDEVTLSEEQLAALEALDSYRLVVTYSSRGTDADGNPIDDTAEIITEYSKADDARRIVMTIIDNTDPGAEQDAMESFQIGTDMYMYAGDDMGWMRISTEESPFADPEFAMMTSGNIFSDLENMRRVRPDERISGIDSRHYQFDEKVLSRVFGEGVGDVTASGDVWIAKDGGFITKYILKIEVKEGSGGIFDPNLATGSIEMSFELQDVNRDITIEVPEEATAGSSLAGFAGAFPMPEDGRIQAAGANFAMIESASPSADVIAFYEQALADLGWTKDEQASMSMGNMAVLAFTKDGAQLSLVVRVDDSTGKTQIMANVE